MNFAVDGNVFYKITVYFFGDFVRIKFTMGGVIPFEVADGVGKCPAPGIQGF